MLRTIIFLIFFTTAFGKTRNSHLQHYHDHDRLQSLVDKLYSEMLLADTGMEETLGDSMEDLDPETEIERRSNSRRSTGSKPRRSTGSKSRRSRDGRSRRSRDGKSRRNTGSNQRRSPPSKGKSEKAKDILSNLGGDLGNSLKDAAFNAAADAAMEAAKNALTGKGGVDNDVVGEEEGDDLTEEETDPEKLDDFSICDLGSECPAGFHIIDDGGCDCMDDNGSACRISSTSNDYGIDPCSETGEETGKSESICDLGSECPAGFHIIDDGGCDCIDDNDNGYACRISSTSNDYGIDPCSE